MGGVKAGVVHRESSSVLYHLGESCSSDIMGHGSSRGSITLNESSSASIPGEHFYEEIVEDRTKFRRNISIVTLDIKHAERTPINSEQEDQNIDVWALSKDNKQRKQCQVDQWFDGFQREEGETERGLKDMKTLSDEWGGTLLSNMKEQ